MRSLVKNLFGAGGPRTIIMFLVVVLIFCGVFGTIALNLNNLQADYGVAGGKHWNATSGEYDDDTANPAINGIPGGPAMIAVVGILGVIVIVMWAIKKAF